MTRIFAHHRLYLHQRIVAVVSSAAAGKGHASGAVPLIGVIGNLSLARDGNAADAVVFIIGVVDGSTIRAAKCLFQTIGIVGVGDTACKRSVVDGLTGFLLEVIVGIFSGCDTVIVGFYITQLIVGKINGFDRIGMIADGVVPGSSQTVQGIVIV